MLCNIYISDIICMQPETFDDRAATINPSSFKRTEKYNLECEFCFKQFEFQSYLNRHLQTHTGEQPFQCGICFKRFKRKHYLKQHTILIHQYQEY